MKTTKRMIDLLGSPYSDNPRCKIFKKYCKNHYRAINEKDICACRWCVLNSDLEFEKWELFEIEKMIACDVLDNLYKPYFRGLSGSAIVQEQKGCFECNNNKLDSDLPISIKVTQNGRDFYLPVFFGAKEETEDPFEKAQQQINKELKENQLDNFEMKIEKYLSSDRGGQVVRKAQKRAKQQGY